jgi:PAS domain S-box-containing protein
MTPHRDAPTPLPGIPAITTGSGSPIPQVESVLLQSFLATVPDHIYFKDLQSRFLAVSEAKAKRDGLTPAMIVGKTDFDIFGEEHARRAYEDEQAIIRTGVPVIDKLEKETWDDGRVTWVLTSKLPLHDAHRKIIGTFGISKDVTKSVETQKALEESNRQLMEATRQAGMAEVATGVLHNVGNVLTSINVTANLLADRFRDSKVTSIFKVCALLRDQSADLPGFFAKDPRAAKLPGYLESLANTLDQERTETMADLSTLLKSIDHVKDVIWMQQSYASVAGVVEPLPLSEAIEDAIKLSNNALLRHNVQVTREFALTPPARAERHKVLQILVNLISNAKKAMDVKEPSQRRLVVRIENTADDTVLVKVIDNGIGISAENLTRIFAHGFTTRKDGHGFGLHSSALAAKQMGGSLTAQSDGAGRGATFILELPSWKGPTQAAANSVSAKAPETCFTPAQAARPV